MNTSVRSMQSAMNVMNIELILYSICISSKDGESTDWHFRKWETAIRAILERKRSK